MVSSIHSAGGRALTNCMRRNCVWTAEESASETVCRPPIFDRPPLRVMSPTLTVLPVRLVYCISARSSVPSRWRSSPGVYCRPMYVHFVVQWMSQAGSVLCRVRVRVGTITLGSLCAQKDSPKIFFCCFLVWNFTAKLYRRI